jgi:hypothetical protein
MPFAACPKNADKGAMSMPRVIMVVSVLAGLLASPSSRASAASVDWRTKGVVTAVEDQGDSGCNVSWAFAVNGAVSSEIVLSGLGSLVDLSEQQLIDCNAAGGGTTCACPQLGSTFGFIGANGICTDAAYPYTGQQGTCRSCIASPTTSSAGVVEVTGGNEAALISAINAGPVIARIEVGSNGQPLPAYLTYAGGVFAPAGWDASFVQWVLVVGYTDAEYIIKNSLGTGWGESGYMRIPRGGNSLGIANFVYRISLGGGTQDAVPGAPCSPWLDAPALSPAALGALVSLLGLVSIASMRRPRRRGGKGDESNYRARSSCGSGEAIRIISVRRSRAEEVELYEGQEAR